MKRFTVLHTSAKGVLTAHWVKIISGREPTKSEYQNIQRAIRRIPKKIRLGDYLAKVSAIFAKRKFDISMMDSLLLK